MKKITSCDNDLIKDIVLLLKKASERKKRKLALFEGLHLAESCLNEKLTINYLFVREEALKSTDVYGIVQRFKSEKIECIVVSSAVFSKMTSLTHGGDVLVIAHYPEPLFVENQSPSDSIVLLDGIQDPGNLGTILRTVAASGIKHVFISSGSVDAWSPKVVRAGMGAHFFLGIYEQVDLALVLKNFNGKKIVTALDAELSLYETDLTGCCAFIFGNEGAGVSRHLYLLANSAVIIPMPGKTESLNVSSSVAICLFEKVRQTKSLFRVT